MQNKSIKKVLIIGSGPIVIGQAAEFDYAGVQACIELKKNGIKTIVINSNPATIMTDKEVADIVYIEELNIENIENIIKEEKPDAILPNMGGQTALNLAIELYEKKILQKYHIKLLGTSIESIKKAEDRMLFKQTMQKINQPCIPSQIVNSLAAAKQFIKKNGYPVIIRPAYTMGGLGGGIAHNDNQLNEIVSSGIRYSRIKQILIEKDVTG
jgi:carbamoyl-phosphate synthase large subunit